MSRDAFGAGRDRLRRAAVSTVVGLSLIAAACSGDDDETDSSEVATVSTEQAVTTGAPVTTSPDTTSAPSTTGGDDTTAPETTGGVDTTGAPGTSGAPDTTGAPLEETDPDATLHLTYNFPADTLDPHLEAGGGMRPYWRLAYDTLFEDDFTDGPQPGVVTEYEFSEDGLTFVAQLRDDVLFADGSAVDAEAVAASLDRARGPEANPGVSGLLAAVESVEASGEYEVTINLTSYVPHLPGILAGPAGAIVNPAAFGDPEALKSQTAGSGPYQSVSFVSQQEAVYERSPVEYWIPEGGRVAQITFTTVPDLQTNLNGFQSGEYDVFFSQGQGEQIVSVLGDDPQITDFPAVQADSVFLSSTRGVLADPLVRQALNFGVDREGIAAGVYQNDCVATSQNFPEGNPLHLDEAPYTYDPDRARELIAEAGAEGASFEIIDQGNTVQVAAASALLQQWSEIGLDVTQRTVPTGAFAEFSAGNLDTFVSGLAKQAHPNLALIRYFLPGGPFQLAADNTTITENYQTLLDPAATDDEIDSAYQTIAEEIVGNAYIVPICTPTQHLVGGEDIVIPDNSMPQGTPDYRFLAVRAD